MDRRSLKRLLWWLGITVFVSHAYFYNGAQWNHNARLDAIYAFVEPGQPETGSFRIDRFITDADVGVNTGDWAKHGDHYYSNKAPGTIWLGIPAYFTLFSLERALGVTPTAAAPALLNAYLIQLAVTVFWVALSAPCFFLMAARLSGSFTTAMTATLALYWGSLLFPFSTQLWGHPSAAAFVVFGLHALSRETQRALLLAGLCLGTAVCCDYLAAVMVVAVMLALASTRRARNLPALTAGGALPALALAAYHWICFGSPFTTASAHSNPKFLVEGQLGGLFGGISLEALWGITFSPYRGLFVVCPVLLLALPAAYLSRVAQGASTLRRAAVLSALSMLLVNACFNGWHGGSSAGPRYQILALPAYGLLLAGLPDGKVWRRTFWLLLTVSVSNMLLIALTIPAAPEAWRTPLATLYESGLRMLVTGEDLTHRWKLPVGLVPPDAPELTSLASFDLGALVGLYGLPAVIPWLLIMALSAWLGRRLLERIS